MSMFLDLENTFQPKTAYFETVLVFTKQGTSQFWKFEPTYGCNSKIENVKTMTYIL